MSLAQDPRLEFDLRPDPRILPMLGEINLAERRCVAELVDNSVDSFLDARACGNPIPAPEIHISIPVSDDPSARITVRDNGTGMAADKLENAMRAGWSGNDPTVSLEWRPGEPMSGCVPAVERPHDCTWRAPWARVPGNPNSVGTIPVIVPSSLFRAWQVPIDVDGSVACAHADPSGTPRVPSYSTTSALILTEPSHRAIVQMARAFGPDGDSATLTQRTPVTRCFLA
jgi:hypothetical protein